MFANAMSQMMPKIIPPLMAQFWTNVASSNNEALTNAFSDATNQTIFKLPPVGKNAQKSFGQGGGLLDMGGLTIGSGRCLSEVSDSNRKGKATTLHVYHKLRWAEVKTANPTWNRD